MAVEKKILWLAIAVMHDRLQYNHSLKRGDDSILFIISLTLCESQRRKGPELYYGLILYTRIFLTASYSKEKNSETCRW